MGQEQSKPNSEYYQYGKYEYREKGLIANGGQGKVYEGREIDNHKRLVAFKVIDIDMKSKCFINV